MAQKTRLRSIAARNLDALRCEIQRAKGRLVRDTGIGLSPAMLPRVFDLFALADRSLVRAQGGSAQAGFDHHLVKPVALDEHQRLLIRLEPLAQPTADRRA